MAKSLRAFGAVVAVFLCASLVPSEAYAQAGSCGPSSSLGSYDEIIEDAVDFSPASDVSVQMLTAVFGSDYLAMSQSPSGTAAVDPAIIDRARAQGSVGRTPTAVAGDDEGAFFTGPSGILGVLSIVINAACLALTGWLLMVTVLTGSLNSANEGKVLGQQYSTLWVPLRSILAIGSLMPVFGGYSLAQQIIMIVSRIAIGFANIAFVAGTNFIMAAGGSVIQQNQIPADDIAANMVAMQTCLAYADGQGIGTDVAYEDGVEDRYHSPGNPSGVLKAVDYTITANVSSDATDQPMAACGQIRMGIPGDFSEEGGNDLPGQNAAMYKAAYDNYWGTLKSVFRNLAPVGGQLANYQNVDLDLWIREQDRLRAASESLMASMQGITRMGATARVCDVVVELKDLGWSMLGALYWNVASISSENLTRAAQISSHIESKGALTSAYAANKGTTGAPWTRESLLIDYLPVQRNLATAGKQVGQANVSAFSGLSQPSDRLNRAVETNFGDTDSGWSWVLRPLNPLSDMVVDSLTADGDFIQNMAALGRGIMIVIEAIFGIGMVAMISTAVADGTFLGKFFSSAAELTGVGFTAKAGAAGMSAIFMPLLLTLILPITVLALYLGFYLPAIPIIYWIGSVTTWLIANVQAVISMPIWAAAHVVPQGNGFSSDQARNGYMTILSVLLRPLLMVVGFFAGMGVLQVVGLFIGGIFPMAFRGITTDSWFGIVAFIMSIAILVIILIATANRVFSLAFDLADDILEYFGGGRRQLGDERIGQQAGGMFVGGFMSRAERSMSPSAMPRGGGGGKDDKKGGDGGGDNSGGGGRLLNKDPA